MPCRWNVLACSVPVLSGACHVLQVPCPVTPVLARLRYSHFPGIALSVVTPCFVCHAWPVQACPSVVLVCDVIARPCNVLAMFCPCPFLPRPARSLRSPFLVVASVVLA